jgi:hypothetical protein
MFKLVYICVPVYKSANNGVQLILKIRLHDNLSLILIYRKHRRCPLSVVIDAYNLLCIFFFVAYRQWIIEHRRLMRTRLNSNFTPSSSAAKTLQLQPQLLLNAIWSVWEKLLISTGPAKRWWMLFCLSSLPLTRPTVSVTVFTFLYTVSGPLDALDMVDWECLVSSHSSNCDFDLRRLSCLQTNIHLSRT